MPGISLEESDRIGRRAEELLLTIPEIETVARKTGRAELDEHALGVNTSEIEAPFTLKERSREELTAEVREKLGTLVGANVEIGQPISHLIDAMLSGTKASIAIAAKKGPFEAYKGSDWDKGLIIGKNEEWFKQNSKYYAQWKQVFEDLKKYGVRNSQITAIAPNTSSSLIQGCSASILPVYSKYFVETHAKGSIPNCPMYIKEKFWYYQENKNISQQKVVDIISRINKWIDTGISFELIYNLNMDIKAKDIFDTIMLAWKKEIKTLYYTRSIQKDGSSAKKAECISCAG